MHCYFSSKLNLNYSYSFTVLQFRFSLNFSFDAISVLVFKPLLYYFSSEMSDNMDRKLQQNCDVYYRIKHTASVFYTGIYFILVP